MPSQESLIVDLEHTDGWLTLQWADGRRNRFPAIWLRDNIPSGRHAELGQRLFDVAALPEQITLKRVELAEDGGVLITFAPEGFDEQFDASWLSSHALDGEDSKLRHKPTLWDARLEPGIEFFEYGDVATQVPALANWLRNARDLGFALLRGVPTEPTSVLGVVELFGYVRETNYGRLFDVITEPSPANLANTGLALGPHTDNPYRDPVPGLQLLHCLQSEVEGGESVLVDGFSVAERLRAKAPEQFELLAQHRVPFRYVEPGVVDLQTSQPIIETDKQGEVLAVRYNNRSSAPFDLPVEVVTDFYRAYRRFGQLLQEPSQHVSFKLNPGDLVMFDNQRVLHARKGFSGGGRHLQGCYADKDALNSKLRVLETTG